MQRTLTITRRMAYAGMLAANLLPYGAMSASSAEVAREGIEGILVTAQRREEPLQSTPVAVTAFNDESLQARNIDSIDSLARFTPGLRLDGAAALGGGKYNTTIFIRGAGQNDFAIFSDPGVGMYVDGVYYARSIGALMDVLDLRSIEVLRGPQGTLFGKNTIGGAVLIASQKPDEKLGGKLELTGGSLERRDVKASLNVPLIEGRLFGRLSLASLHRDGYAHRLIDGEELGDRNSDAGRLLFRLIASDALTIDLSGDFTTAREHSAPNKLVTVGPAPAYPGTPFLNNYNSYVAPTLGIVAPDGQSTLNSSWITSDPYTTYATGPNIDNLDVSGTSATIHWDAGAFAVTSVSAYRRLHAVFGRDGDNTPFAFRETFNDDRQHQFSEELQFSGSSFGDHLNWVAGIFYFNEAATDHARADLAMGLQPPAVQTAPFSPAALAAIRVDNESFAAFAQASLQITDRLSATLGLRGNRDERRIHVRNQRQRDGVVFVDATASAQWTSYTPKAGVEYKLNNDAMAYVSASRGFKSGGFNARALVSAAEVTEYNPETMLTYELGTKTAWLDRRWVANLAVYLSKYSDIQLTVNQTPSNFVGNAARAQIKGVELELAAKPLASVDFNFVVAHTDARYTEVGGGLSGNQVLPITLQSKLVKTPEWMIGSGLQYTHAAGAWGTLAWRGDLSYTSEVFNDVANSPGINQSGYSLVSARVTLISASELWRVAASGTNLTNKLYIVSGNGSPAFGLAEVSYGPPRQWALTLSRSF